MNVFWFSLSEKGKPEHFEEFSTENLDEALKRFYANARTEKGEMYKVSSFGQIRYGITRYLKDKHQIDISGEEFQKSNKTFKAVKDLMSRGKGKVDHRPSIAQR